MLEHRESEVGNPELDNVGSSATAVLRAYFSIRLLGPEAVKGKALQLRLKVDEHVESLAAWAGAFLRADESDMEEAQARANTLRREIARLHSDFVTAGTGVIADIAPSAAQAN
ncbi:hypothetical protein OG819_14285 [Streptomyces sp. NBC_01549]|nr:hypothetical protein [Streptomyces sp. NBC_01549]